MESKDLFSRNSKKANIGNVTRRMQPSVCDMLTISGAFRASAEFWSMQNFDQSLRKGSERNIHFLYSHFPSRVEDRKKKWEEENKSELDGQES